MGVSISSPTNNGTVQSTFSATGSVTISTPGLSGTMAQTGQNAVAGTVTKAPEDKDTTFAIQFANVPVGTGYTLTVFQGGPATGVSITGLKVVSPTPDGAG